MSDNEAGTPTEPTREPAPPTGEPTAESRNAEPTESADVASTAAAPVASTTPTADTAPTSDTGYLPPVVASSAPGSSTPTSAGSGGQLPPPYTRPAASVGAEPPRRRIWGPVLAGVAIGAVLGGVSGAGAGYLLQQGGGTGTGMPVSGPQTITVNDYDDTTLVSAVAAEAMPSVVTVSVVGRNGSGTGSGVVIDDDGHIVTNNHVVTLGGMEASPSIRVTTSSGRVFDAEVVGTDPLMDLAVLEVEGASELVPVEFADSRDLNVGDTTIAIGAPLGLSGTVTSGIVSSLDRSIQVASSAVPGDEGTDSPPDEGTIPGNPFDFFRFDLPDAPQSQVGASGLIQLAVIQTDTAINSGNSGGALLDANGRLIGINVAIATGGGANKGNIGVGFAIPSNIAQRVAEELIAHGEATHGLLGVSVANVTDDPAQADATVIGASVVEVVPGGAADAAGVQVGDIIIGLDGVSITNKTDITAQVRTHAAGSTVELVYVRGDQVRTAEVTLGDLGELLG